MRLRAFSSRGLVRRLVDEAGCYSTNLAPTNLIHNKSGFLDKYFDMLKALDGCLSPVIAFPQIKELPLLKAIYDDRKIP
jgi:hypothetical protein